MKAKILIVGGGAMGTCIALHAASRCDPLKEPVILIEKDRLGAGSSGRSGAIVHQGYGDRVLAGMARDALKVYSGLKASTGRSVGYRRTGVLVVAGPANPAAVERLRRAQEMQVSIGIDARLVEAAEMRMIVPGIMVADGSIGVFEPDGGFVDPVRTIEAFATLARNRGAITRIGVKNPTVLVEGGRAVGVETTAGAFYAPNVVLATGPWTPKILSDLGVDLPLKVVRTREHFLKMPRPESQDDEDPGAEHLGAEFETRFIPDPLDRMPVAHPVVFDHDTGFHARCEPAAARTRVGRIGFAGCEEIVDPENAIDPGDPDFPKWVRDSVEARMPVYGELPDIGSHTALVALTPDERPIVGPIDELPGLYVVSGFSGNDFQLAPSIGEGLAQMIVGQPVSAIDPEFFSPSRFQNA